MAKIKLSESGKTFIELLATKGFIELTIDVNVDLSNETPKTLNVPKNIKIIIDYGCSIITPIVSLPINGLVKENYLQINFFGVFVADRNQIFYGDGLIWFCGNSVETIYADWWGIKVKSKSSATSNVKAIQQAINSVTLNRSKTRGLATTKIKLPPNDIYMDSPVVAFSCDIDSHPFLTGRRNDKPVYSTIVNIEGNETIKHGSNFGNTTNIIYLANWGAPFMLQGLRNSSAINFSCEGQNKINSKDGVMLAGYSGNQALKNFVRPDDFKSYDKAKIGWISDNIVWGRNKPYAAIITDPFNDLDGGFTKARCPESTIDLYYGIETHQNSWSVIFENQHCTDFVSWVVNTLTGQQGDTFQYNNIMVTDQPFGVSTCQDQSRDCKATNFMAYVNVWSAFEGFVHGDGHGVCPEIQSFHSAGGLKYITAGHDGRRGIITIGNAYVELVYAIGRNANNEEALTGTSINFTGSITNSTIKYADKFSYLINDKERYLPQRPTIENFGIINTHIGIYGYENIAKTQGQFRSCTILNCAINGGHPTDANWWIGGGVSSSNNVKLIGIVPNRKNIDENIKLDNQNSGRTSGELKINTVYNKNGIEPMYRYKSYPLEETFDLRKLNVETIVDKESNCIILKGIKAMLLNDGELVFIYGNSKNEIGTVYSKTSTEVVIGNLKKSNVQAYTGSVSIFKRYVTKSHLPFMFTAIGKELTVEYGSIGQTTDMPVLNDMVLRLPDGKIYYIEKTVGNIITVDREYKGLNDWVVPLYPNYETFGIITNKKSNKLNGFYISGETYQEYSDEFTMTKNKLLCIGTGNSKTAIFNNQ